MPKYFLLLLVFFGFLFFPSQVKGQYSCSDCCPTAYDWCSGWCLRGDYLYWTPRKIGLDWVMDVREVDQFPIGQLYSVDPDYTSGFRTGIQKIFCDWSIGVDYTYFRSTSEGSRDRTTPPATRELSDTRILNQDIQVQPNNLDVSRARYAVNLDLVDVELGTCWGQGRLGCNRLFGGVRLGRIGQTFRSDYFQTVSGPGREDHYKATVALNAYGLYLGSEFKKCLFSFCGCGDLSLYGKGGIGGLMGHFYSRVSATSDNSADPVSTNLRETNMNSLVGNIDLAAGLGYDIPDFCWGCWSLLVGYEFHLWLNMVDFMTINETGNSIVANDPSRYRDTLGFDGLFVKFVVCF